MPTKMANLVIADRIFVWEYDTPHRARSYRGMGGMPPNQITDMNQPPTGLLNTEFSFGTCFLYKIPAPPKVRGKEDIAPPGQCVQLRGCPTPHCRYGPDKRMLHSLIIRFPLLKTSNVFRANIMVRLQFLLLDMRNRKLTLFPRKNLYPFRWKSVYSNQQLHVVIQLRAKPVEYYVFQPVRKWRQR